MSLLPRFGGRRGLRKLHCRTTLPTFYATFPASKGKPASPQVGKWDERPTTATNCLAFVADSSNVDLASKKVANVPRKHVGNFSGGMIYHYSNSQNKVVKQTPAQFSDHYSGENIEVFDGSFRSSASILVPTRMLPMGTLETHS